MGYLSFNLKYFEKEITKFENSEVTNENIYKAKQLLKTLDDLVDEGYLELYDEIEKNFNGVSRLRNYIYTNNDCPFPIISIDSKNTIYADNEQELSFAIHQAMDKASTCTTTIELEIINDLVHFCNWIGYDNETAYIFLLRDTLLPYIYYKASNRQNIYPWLIGRKTLKQLTKTDQADDDIRLQIICALEDNKCNDFNKFSNYVLPKIRDIIKNKYQVIEETLLDLLKSIKTKRIIVIESGCYGTFPMLLMSLDERVDIRMYTTLPYLFKAYEGKVYTHKYENNRLFETIYSQDLLFQYSRYDNKLFYIKQACSKDVEEKAYEEINTIIKSACKEQL